MGNNLKSLELSEEKALEKEDTYNAQIRDLDARMKEVGVARPPLLPRSLPYTPVVANMLRMPPSIQQNECVRVCV